VLVINDFILYEKNNSRKEYLVEKLKLFEKSTIILKYKTIYKNLKELICINFCNVFCRLRPPNLREEQENKNKINLSIDENVIKIQENNIINELKFDRIFPAHTTQESIFQELKSKYFKDMISGINVTFLSCGFYKSGKQYTTIGIMNENDENDLGLLPRFIKEILLEIKKKDTDTIKFFLSVSIMDIDGESITDCLNYDKEDIRIRENKSNGIYIEKIKEILLENYNQFIAIQAQVFEYYAMKTTGSRTRSEVKDTTIYIFTLRRNNIKENTSFFSKN